MDKARKQSYFNLVMHWNIQALAISLIVLTSIFSGCVTSVKQEPFTKFSESADSLRDGTDKAMNVLIPQTVARYKQDLIEELTTKESDELFTSSRLELKEGDSFHFESVPRYMVFDQFKVGLLSTTDSMHKYTVLLLDFANEEIQNEDEFNKFAKDLNVNASEAVRMINKAAGKQTAENIGLISTAAAALFNNYLKYQQKKVLIEAIAKNQPTVEQYAEKVKQAIIIIANASNQEYLHNSNDLKKQMLDSQKRSSAIDALIKLNREHFAQIQTLNVLKDSVNQFPSAHKELESAVKNPDLSLVHIIELVNRGNQLKAMVESAQKANKNKLLETDLNQVEVQAVALETDAKLSALDAANAQAEAVLARIAANADPNNAQKEAKAKELEERASQLKEIAEKKAESAKLAREAADAVKSSVQALTN